MSILFQFEFCPLAVIMPIDPELCPRYTSLFVDVIVAPFVRLTLAVPYAAMLTFPVFVHNEFCPEILIMPFEF